MVDSRRDLGVTVDARAYELHPEIPAAADRAAAERLVRLCNSGVMGFRSEQLLAILVAIGNANAKGEYYLTDAVEIARARGLRTAVVTCPQDEVLGVNSRAQQAQAEAIYQRRARERLMADGVTLIDPLTLYVSFDTVIGRDVIIEPNVFLGPGVTIADKAEIKAYCHFENARVGKGARVGPFARLRPGADPMQLPAAWLARQQNVCDADEVDADEAPR